MDLRIPINKVSGLAESFMCAKAEPTGWMLYHVENVAYREPPTCSEVQAMMGYFRSRYGITPRKPRHQTVTLATLRRAWRKR